MRGSRTLLQGGELPSLVVRAITACPHNAAIQVRRTPCLKQLSQHESYAQVDHEVKNMTAASNLIWGPKRSNPLPGQEFHDVYRNEWSVVLLRTGCGGAATFLASL